MDEIKRLYQLKSVVKLASNENAFGPSPKVLTAMNAQLDEQILRYPDGNGYALKKRLSSFHHVEMTQITLGNGSNDVLEMIARVFLGAGRSALFSQHAFAVYPLATIAAGAEMQVIPAKDFGCDLTAFTNNIDEMTKVIFIANPNNPTGTFLEASALKRFIKQVPSHVVASYVYTTFHYITGTEPSCYDIRKNSLCR